MTSTSKSADNKITYLDNNATTIMPQQVINTITKWFNRGNPSSSYASANECKKMFKAFRSYIAEECGFEMDTMDGYTIIFTSGASESNSHIITSCIRAYAKKTNVIPHVVISNVEHKSVLMCCEQLEKDKLCQVTYLPVINDRQNIYYGCIDPETLKRSIRPNTCLVSIMAVNNETGIMNNVLEIGKICREAKVPFHTDLVQLFGKTIIKPNELNIDAFSVSFHKIHGPPAVGLLVVRNKLIKGYDLPPIIYGTQNYSLRGGTENVASVAGSFMAYKMAMLNLTEKTNEIRKKRDLIKSVIGKRVPTCYIQDYTPNHGKRCVVVWLSPKLPMLTVPNTLFMTIDKPGMCNIKLKEKLEANGIIISIGSACNTNSKKASHVIDALAIPLNLRPGVLRISLSDNTSENDIMYFCKVFLHYILKD
jgi:cysteine desulfurase